MTATVSGTEGWQADHANPGDKAEARDCEKNIADKVFDELNKGVPIVDAKELARSLKEAHLGA